MSNTLLPRLARLPSPADPPDDALLGRFAADRSEEAFALLVARHGPMVFAVCRRVLGNTTDADDAFQAAFLVLVRRANDVRNADRLAGWLYGVAYRTAVEARSLRAARRKRETTGEVPDVPHTPAATDTELSAVVERELASLPDRYRLAVALCDLDGRTRTEAATLLGIPEGTLSSRLNAGRKRLAERLARWGYGPAVVAGVAAPASAVPLPSLQSTIRLASGAVPESVSPICEGVIRTMTAKCKLVGWAAAGLLACGLAATAAAVAAPQGEPAAKAAADDKKADNREPAPWQIPVGDAPPVVVKTVPAAGDEAVDPATKEIRVTFSKPMADKSWSWATDSNFGAELPGADKPYYDKDKKTCVYPVKLEPNRTYAVWLNSDKFTNFKDADGRSSLPYLLVFSTAKAGKAK